MSIAPPTGGRAAHDREILARLDLRAEAEALGLLFAAVDPTGDGWVRCHAVGREDRNPSASFNVRTGYYKDHAGESGPLSFWDLAVALGRFDDWRAARDHYAAVPARSPADAGRQRQRNLARSGPGGGSADGRRRRRAFPTAESARAALERKHGPAPAVWTYRDAAGDPVGLVLRWDRPDGKDIRPVSKWPDGWRCEGMPKPRPLYALPELLASAGRVYVCEGEKATDALRSVGLTATTSPGGSNAAGKADWSPLAGREAVILPDNDPPGRKYAETVAEILAALDPPAAVRVLDLPGLPEKGDAWDWINEIHDAAEPDALRERIDGFADAAPIRESPEAPEPLPDGRAEIAVTPDEYAVNERAAAALAADPTLYRRGASLVRVVWDDAAVGGIEHREPTPRITPLDPSQVRDALTRTCRFTRAVEKGGEVVDRHVHPPAWCVAAVHKRADWPGLRPLAGVTTIPVLRPDGTLLSAPGYDEASRLLYLPTGPQPDVPDAPTLADAVTAANLLLSLVADFPFEAPEHRAAWLAGLLTPLARHAFAGPAPLFLLDANVRGSGKSLLCEIIGLIDSGRAMPRMAAPKDEDETRKRITALAIEGSPFVLIDNVPGTLGGASLDAALTSTVWKDRLLGESRTVEVPLTAVWYATGNNVALLADTARRVIHVRLDSPHERPEERTDFRQPDIERHVRAERPRYLAAALTVLRGWYAAGRPEANVPAFGSFAGWSGVVRQCLVWLGLPDPALTRTELVERSDRTAGALAGVVAGLASFDPEGEGVTANELVRRLEAEPDRHEGLRSALLDLCDAAAGRLPSPRRIGNQLGHLRNRVVGGRCLDYRTSSGARRWFVRAAGRDARTADR